MVKAATLLVAAAFVVGPILAAPAPPHHHHHAHHHKHAAADSAPVRTSSSAVTRRSIDDPDLLDIEAREPNPFSFKKFFRKVGRVVKKAAPIAMTAAPLILRRDEEGNLYVRELDAEELSYLEARDPKLHLGRTFRKIGGAVKKGLGVADRVLSTAHRLGLRELEDGASLEERELDPSGLSFDLEERDFDELDEREPFKFGRLLRKVKGTGSRVLRVADKVSSTAHSLGLRELEDEALEVEARSLNELD